MHGTAAAWRQREREREMCLSFCVVLACSTATVYVMSVVGLSKAPAQIPVDVLVRFVNSIRLKRERKHALYIRCVYIYIYVYNSTKDGRWD